jgi:hypothetical protein
MKKKLQGSRKASGQHTSMADKDDTEMEDTNPNAEAEEGSDSDSSDSDEDSGSEKDAHEEQEDVSLLEARIKTTGGRDYDAFVHLLRIFRDNSQMMELEKIREEFSASYPLAEGQ